MLFTPISEQVTHLQNSLVLSQDASHVASLLIGLMVSCNVRFCVCGETGLLSNYACLKSEPSKDRHES